MSAKECFDLSSLQDIISNQNDDDGEENASGKMYLPKKLDKHQNLPVKEGLDVVNEQDVINYLQYLMVGDCRIMSVNGVYADPWCMSCDYCGNSLVIINAYYCYDCQKDMCAECFSETSEEIALENGAKNWHLRKDTLEKCRNGHELETRNLVNSLQCDECGSDIGYQTFYSNRDIDYDVCKDCYTPEIVREHDLVENEAMSKEKVEKMNHFGNILDWVPLYLETQEDEPAYILQCLNPENTYYGYFAFACCDDHGRYGYYTCKKNTTLDSLLDEYVELRRRTDDRLQRYEEEQKRKGLKDEDNSLVKLGNEPGSDSDDSDTSDYCRGWGKVYNTPLRQMMA